MITVIKDKFKGFFKGLVSYRVNKCIWEFENGKLEVCLGLSYKWSTGGVVWGLWFLGMALHFRLGGHVWVWIRLIN